MPTEKYDDEFLTEEEIQEQIKKTKNSLITKITKTDRDEIIKYDFSEKKEKSKSIWLTIKKVFGL